MLSTSERIQGWGGIYFHTDNYCLYSATAHMDFGEAWVQQCTVPAPATAPGMLPDAPCVWEDSFLLEGTGCAYGYTTIGTHRLCPQTGNFWTTALPHGLWRIRVPMNCQDIYGDFASGDVVGIQISI